MSTTTRSTTPATSFNHPGAKMNARSVSPATMASCLISRLSNAGESVSAKLKLRRAGITPSALYLDAGETGLGPSRHRAAQIRLLRWIRGLNLDEPEHR